MMNRVLTFAAAAMAAALLPAADVLSDAAWSAVMGRRVALTVVLPDGYRGGTNRYPVVVALHGASGNDGQYATLFPVQKYVDKYRFICVAPFGEHGSWWLDAPKNPKIKMETFVSKELVAHVDAAYRTLPSRAKRGIFGNSMGGHGACYLGFRHKDVFGVVGNIFGGVDLRVFPEKWNKTEQLGPIGENLDLWTEHSVVTQAKHVKNGDMELITLVGTQDFFLQANRDLHDLLARNKVKHTYIEHTAATDAGCSHAPAFVNDFALPVMFEFFDATFNKGEP